MRELEAGHCRCVPVADHERRQRGHSHHNAEREERDALSPIHRAPPCLDGDQERRDQPQQDAEARVDRQGIERQQPRGSEIETGQCEAQAEEHEQEERHRPVRHIGSDDEYLERPERQEQQRNERVPEIDPAAESRFHEQRNRHAQHDDDAGDHRIHDTVPSAQVGHQAGEDPAHPEPVRPVLPAEERPHAGALEERVVVIPLVPEENVHLLPGDEAKEAPRQEASYRHDQPECAPRRRVRGDTRPLPDCRRGFPPRIARRVREGHGRQAMP